MRTPKRGFAGEKVRGTVSGPVGSAGPQSDARPPYASYAVLLGTFLAGTSLVVGLARRLERDPPERTLVDLAILGLATFKAARTLATDEVTSFIREPFVEGTPGREEDEHAVQNGGFRQAVGELVTCSRCVGTWAAAAIAGIDVLLPRFGRMLSWTLAVGAANDWLQAGFAALTGFANRQRSS